jgi:hypothetical protein
LKVLVFTVFISHSTKDISVVHELANWIKSVNINVSVAELDFRAGQPLPDKIAKMIDGSDCVLAVLTLGGMRSEWVNQEIGYAKKAGKTIIPIVEKGVETKGFITNLEYIHFHKDNINDAVIKAANYLQRLALQKTERERQNAFWGGLMLLGLLALLASSD